MSTELTLELTILETSGMTINYSSQPPTATRTSRCQSNCQKTSPLATTLCPARQRRRRLLRLRLNRPTPACEALPAAGRRVARPARRRRRQRRRRISNGMQDRDDERRFRCLCRLDRMEDSRQENTLQKRQKIYSSVNGELRT